MFSFNKKNAKCVLPGPTAALLGHCLLEPAFAPAALMTLMPLLIARSLGLCTRQLPRLLVALNLWDL